CPDFNETADMCAVTSTTSDQTQTTAGLAGQGAGGGQPGKGGCDSQIDPFTTGGCNCTLPGLDTVNCPHGAFSAPGSNGAVGTKGAGGGACAAVAGSVVAGEWRGNVGGAASGGGAGGGGGGGGAGGGIEQYRDAANDACLTGASDFGGSGGGGGAGGCGSAG